MIGSLLFSFLPVFHRTEMLESTYTRNGIKGPELLRCDFTAVSHINLQSVSSTGLCLALGKGESNTFCPFFLDVFRKRPPTTAHVQHLVSLLNTKTFRNVVVLRSLCFFQGKGKYGIVFGTAEVGGFPQT